MLCLAQENYYDNVILPFLLRGSSKLSQVVMIGRGGKGVTFDAFYTRALLPQVDPSNDCLIVPEAPIEVLQQFGELIHTGRWECFIGFCEIIICLVFSTSKGLSSHEAEWVSILAKTLCGTRNSISALPSGPASSPSPANNSFADSPRASVKLSATPAETPPSPSAPLPPVDIYTVSAEIQVPLDQCTTAAGLKVTTLATHGDPSLEPQLAGALLMPGGDQAAGGDEGGQGGGEAAGVDEVDRPQVNTFLASLKNFLPSTFFSYRHLPSWNATSVA